MRKALLRLSLVGLFAVTVIGAQFGSTKTSLGEHYCATCTGGDPCNACKNCKYCGHCAKSGGTCGVCK